MQRKISKITFVVFVFFLILMLSCCSTKQTEYSKEITVAQGICKLLVEQKCEAAYSRMAESYRIGVSLENFEKNILQHFNSKTTIQKMKFKTYFQNESYYSILCELKTDKKIYCSFVFSKGLLFPIDVKLYNEKPKIKIKSKDKKINESEEIVSGNFDLTKALNSESLKDLCNDYFKLGCGLYGYNLETCAINHKEYMQITKKHFNSCTLTNLMKPTYILNEKESLKNAKVNKINAEPVLDFSCIEQTLKWCKENEVQMRGHTLVWHTQTPKWFFCQDYDSSKPFVSREVMIFRLDSFVKQYLQYVQNNFPGVVYCWDVVNEAVDPYNGDLTSNYRCRIQNDGNENYWYSIIGSDYPEVSFKIARKYAAPEVKLFYNDYGTIDKTKRGYIFNLCKNLKEQNLIDGIGLQGYWDINNPKLWEIKEAIEFYAQLGLELQLTEWSIHAKENSDTAFIEQAQRYATVFRLLKQLDTQGGGKANITCVSFFGVMDGYTLYGNDTTNSRLFDKDLQPKPVFYSVKDTFSIFYKK